MTYVIVALCIVGAYAASHMQVKNLRAQRGELLEPSVVQTARARLVGGIPNSAIGLSYYALMAIAAFFFGVPLVHWAALTAAALAACMSAYLAYSLLFVTRMPCPYCWTGHVVNWFLLGVLLFTR